MFLMIMCLVLFNEGGLYLRYFYIIIIIITIIIKIVFKIKINKYKYIDKSLLFIFNF